MQYIAFILNLPWTLCGLLAVPFSLPVGVSFSKRPIAIIFKVKSFWWYRWLPGRKGVRAIVNGTASRWGRDPTPLTFTMSLSMLHSTCAAPSFTYFSTRGSRFAMDIKAISTKTKHIRYREADTVGMPMGSGMVPVKNKGTDTSGPCRPVN